MKVKIGWLVMMGICCVTCIQAQVTNNGKIVLDSGSVLVINNAGLINNGNFQQTAGKVKFTGTDTGSISGTGGVHFYDLEIAKTDTARVLLMRNISIGHTVLFSEGYLHLNNSNLLLSENAILSGERENSRITGDNGGFVEISAPLNAPNNTNPGSVGAIITATSNLGTVTIRRGHVPQQIAGINKKGINRYYHITSSNSGDLNATLRLRYFDAEVNNNVESKFVLWKSTDSINWSAVGQTTRNDNDNFVELTGIHPFSRWTIAEAAAPTGIFDPGNGGAAVKLWPNPCFGEMNLSVTSSSPAKASLLIYDMSGRPVYSREILLLYGNNQFAINLMHFIPGVYYLKLLGKDGSTVVIRFLRLAK